jgi:acetyl esterase/lipase
MADDLAKTHAQSDVDGRVVIPLWPEGPPTVLPPKPAESTFTAPVAGVRDTLMLRNVSEATLSVYPPDPGVAAKGVGVVVCPGGGWRILAREHEGTDVARWLAARGYAAFLLKYRVSATPAEDAEFFAQALAMNTRLAEPKPAAATPRSLEPLMTPAMLQARETAAEDGRRAVALVRERAGEFGVDPAKVGMIGFSAGAFLVADVAMAPGGAPLAFVAPIYGGETRGRPAPADAPPLFTAVAQDDRMLVSIVRKLVDDWFDADRPVESHLYAKGAHGFGMVPQGLPVDGWIDSFGAWLVERGFG